MKEDRKAVIMNNEIARRTSPEEEELARKREELALLQVELAERDNSSMAWLSDFACAGAGSAI
jgi:predicted transcriptional regulator